MSELHQEKALELARGLRALAEFYEANPDMPLPYLDPINIFVSTKAEMIRIARLFGACDKVVSESWFEVRKDFGPFHLAANIPRNSVCERVKTGERVVPEQHVPAREAETIPEHTEAVYEWKCPEALLSSGKQAEQLVEAAPELSE